MATSQHEGHANQLDLLIRAGNVTLCCPHRDAGAAADARLAFVSRAAAPQCAEERAEVMEGNQEVITLVATCMALLHDVWARFKKGNWLSVHGDSDVCTVRVLHGGAGSSPRREM